MLLWEGRVSRNCQLAIDKFSTCSVYIIKSIFIIDSTFKTRLFHIHIWISDFSLNLEISFVIESIFSYGSNGLECTYKLQFAVVSTNPYYSSKIHHLCFLFSPCMHWSFYALDLEAAGWSEPLLHLWDAGKHFLLPQSSGRIWSMLSPSIFSELLSFPPNPV